MTWLLTPYLLEGELDNRQPGKITGWMRFAGMRNKATFNLDGDFCEDIRGKRIILNGRYTGRDRDAVKYLEGFLAYQRGKAGDITLGRPPQKFIDFPYIEWSSAENDRVVLYLEPHQVAVLDEPMGVVAANPGSG